MNGCLDPIIERGRIRPGAADEYPSYALVTANLTAKRMNATALILLDPAVQDGLAEKLIFAFPVQPFRAAGFGDLLAALIRALGIGKSRPDQIIDPGAFALCALALSDL